MLAGLSRTSSQLLRTRQSFIIIKVKSPLIIMAARKSTSAAKKGAAVETPRRSTRGAGVKVEYRDDEDEEGGDEANEETTPIKWESGSRKANVGVKRTASSPPTGGSKTSKRVKTEDGDEDEDEDVKPTVESKDDVKSESGSELSEVDSAIMESESESVSEVESDFSETPVKKTSKAKKSSSAKSTPAKKKQTKSKAKASSKATPESKPASKDDLSPGLKEAALQAKKLKSYSQFSKTSPFPDFPHPTADEAKLAHKILASMHGERKRPEKVVARDDVAGCGDSPSVLDALVRTILSQNTSDKNSTRAKLSMNKAYGGSDEWEKILNGGREKLQETIKSGGLAVVKSKVIISILEQVKERYGKYSLDHLFDATDEDAMAELIGYKGVGPKTASCVLLFCLQRESFAVDTHVYRIAGMLGWRPKSATRDQTHAHLEVMIPDEDKYGLHILMVGHGKKCDECKAGGRSTGKCELRRAFRKGKGEDEEGGEDDVKNEVKEEDDDGDEKGVKEEIKDEEDGVDKENVKEEWESGQEDYVHGMQMKGKGGKKKATKGRKST